MSLRIRHIWFAVLALLAIYGTGCANRRAGNVRLPPPERPRLSPPVYAATPTNTYRPAPATPTPSPAPAPRPDLLAPRPAAPAAAPRPAEAPLGVTYRLRAGDPIVIFLRGILPKDDQIEDIIDEGGYIKLPYLDNILAAGKTTSQLENEIQRLYIDRQIYRHITVNVVMPSQSYYVQGEVKIPGRNPIVTEISLLQAIATAGGTTDFADETKVFVIRGGQSRRYNLKEIKKKPELDVRIEPGDVIRVDRSIW